MPRALCDDVPEFYLSAEGSRTGVKTDPPGASDSVFTAEVGKLAAAPVLAEGFEEGLPSGWSASGLWHASLACVVASVPDGSYWTYYGQDGTLQTPPAPVYNQADRPFCDGGRGKRVTEAERPMLRPRHSLIGFLLAALVALVALAPALVAAQPVPPVRVIAEWEPAVGTLISWPLGIPQALVVELARDDKLFVLVTGQQAENSASSTFASWGIDPAQVEYIHTGVETHWPRDWGPHQVFDGNGQWSIVDPIFEGYPWVDVPCEPVSSPGGHHGDDAVNIDVASYFGTPLHSLPAYLTGGNFQVDGHAAAFSTCVMIGENQQLWTEAEFLDLAQQYLGVADYHVLDNTEDHGIQHIDCWFKPLDEETLLVKQPPTWHEEYDRIEANLAILGSAVNCYGRPYRIVRIDCPPCDGYNIAAYTNSLILNTKVLVPLFDIPGDTQALQTFAEAMPGYQVIGFPWGSWYYYDALHCRTRAVFDRYMLRIAHRRLDAEMAVAPDYPVTAVIDDRSEAGLIADSLRVYWRIQGQAEWTWLLLTPTGQPDTYEAAIPGPEPGVAIEYYVAAADNSGRAEALPRSAPGGFYSFTVIDTGLSIEVTDRPAVVEPWTLTSFGVTIDPGDEVLVPGSARLYYRYDGTTFLSTPLEPLGGNRYRATLPRALCDDVPEFYVSAEGSRTGVKTDPPGAPDNVFTAEVGELAAVPVLAEGFEEGLPTGWSASGLWHVSSACVVAPVPDGSYWTYYGQDATCNYDTGGRNTGALTSAPILLPSMPPGGQVQLRYYSNLQTEDEQGYDLAGLYVNGSLEDVPAESAAWHERSADLTALAGQSIQLEWQFDTIDDYYNDYRGWQVDAVTIEASELVCDFVLPCSPADWDCDDDVYLDDYSVFAECQAGPDSAPAPTPPVTPAQCLAVFDQDGDADVDSTDFAELQIVLPGP